MNLSDTVPVLPEKDWIRVIVAGGQGAIVGQFIGPPAGASGEGMTWITTKVDLPGNWESLAAKYKDLAPKYVRY
jgi:hypothetical protein